MTNEDEPVHDEAECFCFREANKKCCAMYIYVVSVIIFILSLITGIYGYTAINGTKEYKPEVGEYKTSFKVDKNTGFAYAALAGMIVGLLIALFGCGASYMRTAWFAAPYGICTFVIGIVFLVVGAGVLGGQVNDELLKEACETKQKDFGDKTGKQIMEEQYGIVD